MACRRPTGENLRTWPIGPVRERDSKGGIRWLCRCDCGNVIIARGAKLRSGRTKPADACGGRSSKPATRRIPCSQERCRCPNRRRRHEDLRPAWLGDRSVELGATEAANAGHPACGSKRISTDARREAGSVSTRTSASAVAVPAEMAIQRLGTGGEPIDSGVADVRSRRVFGDRGPRIDPRGRPDCLARPLRRWPDLEDAVDPTDTKADRRTPQGRARCLPTSWSM